MSEQTDETMQPIIYDGHPVAMAGKYRFWLTNTVELLPDGHPTKRVVAIMCAFARDVMTGQLPEPYTDERAERFAREVLVPSREFLTRANEEDLDLALHFHVPMQEIVARRAELCTSRTAR